MTQEIPLSIEAHEALKQMADAAVASQRDLSVAFGILVRQLAEYHPAIQFRGMTTSGMLIETPAEPDGN